MRSSRYIPIVQILPNLTDAENSETDYSSNIKDIPYRRLYVFSTQFVLGVGWGWIAPTLSVLQSPNPFFEISVQEAAWLGSINEAGRMIGPFISPLFLDTFGRRKTSVLVSILNVLSWTVVIFSRNISILLATRLLFGISQGLTDVTSSIYITEVCSPELRGFGGSAIMLTAMLGLISGSFLTTYLSFVNAAIVITALAVCTVGMQYFGVETPYFLVMRGKVEEAKKNLDWLRNERDNENELAQIRKNVQEENEKRVSFRVLFSDSTNLRCIFVAVGFYFLISTVGLHAVTPYISLIFSPSKTFTTNEYTILYNVVAFMGGIMSLFVVEKMDRRPFILFTSLMLLCCNIGIAALVYLRSNNYEVGIELYPWLMFASLSFFGFIGVLMCPVVYVFAGEILPLSVRAIGSSMAITASSVGSFVTAILFWPITSYFGMEANFFIYIVASILMIIFIYTMVPETRGKSLYAMHEKSTQPMDQ